MASTMKVDSPEAMRALAHPLRVRILYQLELDRHGRAADLARTLGEPANSISFHLRTLAKAGLIVEAPELARDKRDRVWRNAADNYELAGGTPGIESMKAGYADWFRRVLDADETPESADEPRRHVRIAAHVPLTQEETTAMLAEMDDVVSRWAARALEAYRADRSDPSRTLYDVAVALGPSDTPPGTAP
jgi:DNA-binding transcriptional ArsR family regulator